MENQPKRSATSTMILIGKLDELNLHSRFIVSLRSISLESKYHSIVLYAVDKEPPTAADGDLDPEKELSRRLDSVELSSDQAAAREWHAMEEECPHLGASMAEADIEIEDDAVIAICPWHKLGPDIHLKTLLSIRIQFLELFQQALD
jgi:hypothetical protein